MDMPVVHGREVLKYVKEKHPGIEVIVITGVEDVQLAVESMKAGAYDYLCKPIDETGCSSSWSARWSGRSFAAKSRNCGTR